MNANKMIERARKYKRLKVSNSILKQECKLWKHTVESQAKEILRLNTVIEYL